MIGKPTTFGEGSRSGIRSIPVSCRSDCGDGVIVEGEVSLHAGEDDTYLVALDVEDNVDAGTTELGATEPMV